MWTNYHNFNNNINNLVQFQALTCRTEGGPKEEQLKKIYTNCLKSQSDRNSSNSRDYSSNNRRASNNREHNDSSSREKKKPNQWDRKSDGFGSRDDWSMGSGDWASRNRDQYSGTSGNRDGWGSGTGGREGSSGAGRYDRMPISSSGQDRSSSRDRGMSGRDDYMESSNYGDVSILELLLPCHISLVA